MKNGFKKFKLRKEAIWTLDYDSVGFMQNSKQVSGKVWSTKKKSATPSSFECNSIWRLLTRSHFQVICRKKQCWPKKVFLKLLPTRTTGNVQYFCCILRRILLTEDKELPLCWTGNSAEIRSLCFQAKSPPQKKFSIGISFFILSVCESVWKTAKFYCTYMLRH